MRTTKIECEIEWPVIAEFYCDEVKGPVFLNIQREFDDEIYYYGITPLCLNAIVDKAFNSIPITHEWLLKYCDYCVKNIAESIGMLIKSRYSADDVIGTIKGVE